MRVNASRINYSINNCQPVISHKCFECNRDLIVIMNACANLRSLIGYQEHPESGKTVSPHLFRLTLAHGTVFQQLLQFIRPNPANINCLVSVGTGNIVNANKYYNVDQK